MAKRSNTILAERRRIWKSKEIIRRLYCRWYDLIKEALRGGRTLELGGGSGNLKEFLPDAISSDVLFAPWLDAVIDAHKLPFKNDSFNNIVLFDVLHHLSAPLLFFHEAERVLRSKGRLVMMEPCISWASYFVYRFLHAEGMKWNVDPFGTDSFARKAPFDGNQSIPTLIFEKYRKVFIESFPEMRIIEEKKMDTLIYPLSGGFHQRNLCPRFLWSSLEYLENLFEPVGEYLAFRLFITLEKK